ncbi:MAG: hypothetical protein EI684_06765 [Candidatus Viridilinea halotolerans]|uniref:N-acetyltransferase domain-containing protein n=1 Tax=Candidatus Viridilinea halotolerans TaxID=2491704 RepID=A0A426U3X9_9CHLR|nr:MAG: hypothetical protein EI684_06765 [Candidatus Viridilinea halotolerans]
MKHIEIRLLSSLAEFTACMQLQQAIWGSFSTVPDHLLLTFQRNGGIVLGAFDVAQPAQPIVGFVFGFMGRTHDGQLKHASHMAAVHPAYRDSGLGAKLKWAQREQVLAQGITLMTWTFDPLLSRNAYLNIARLGATSRTYIRNIYGPEPEDPQGELPTDRFWVDWWLNDERVVARSNGSAHLPSAAELRTCGPLLNPDAHTAPAAPHGAACLIQIPSDIAALKEQDMARARAWRYQVRALAEQAFAQGYHVSAFARDGDVGLFLLTH